MQEQSSGSLFHWEPVGETHSIWSTSVAIAHGYWSVRSLIFQSGLLIQQDHLPKEWKRQTNKTYKDWTLELNHHPFLSQSGGQSTRWAKFQEWGNGSHQWRGGISNNLWSFVISHSLLSGYSYLHSSHAASAYPSPDCLISWSALCFSLDTCPMKCSWSKLWCAVV
jgi:hypothetical protein